jgi:uncharacterized protein YutE (UPF0331/DUF86 family)
MSEPVDNAIDTKRIRNIIRRVDAAIEQIGSAKSAVCEKADQLIGTMPEGDDGSKENESAPFNGELYALERKMQMLEECICSLFSEINRLEDI